MQQRRAAANIRAFLGGFIKNPLHLIVAEMITDLKIWITTRLSHATKKPPKVFGSCQGLVIEHSVFCKLIQDIRVIVIHAH